MADIQAERTARPADIRWRRWVRAGRKLSGRELELVVSVLVQVFLAHLLYGANRNDLALGLAGVQALLLLRALTAPWARRALKVRGLLLPGSLYAITLAVIAWGLAPLGEPRSFDAFPWLLNPTGSIDPDASLIALVRMGGLGCMFLQGLLLGASRARASLFMKLFVAAATLYATAALFGFWISPERLYGMERPYHGDRLAGSFLSANSAAAFFGPSLLAALGLLRARGQVEGNFQRNLAPGLAVPILGLALLLTASRGAFAATLAAILVFVISRMVSRARRRWVGSFCLMLAGAAVVIGAAVLLSPIADRLIAAPGDVNVRFAIVSAHWPAIQAELWQGYGAGSFDRVNGMVQTPDTIGRLWSVRALHNVYLQWLEEVGLVGSLPIWGAVAVLLATMGRAALSKRHDPWPAVVLAMSTVLLLHGLVDYSLEVPSLAGAWALVLGLGYARSVPRNRPDERARQSRRPRLTSLELRRSLAAVTAAMTLALAGVVFIQAVRSDAAGQGLAPNVEVLRAAAQKSPADAEAWLQLAIAEEELAGACQIPCQSDLTNSFRAAPLARPIFAWRTRFMLEHWDQLPVALREAALQHIRVEWGTRPGRRDIQGLSKVVVNPAGRLASLLTLQSLVAAERREKQAPSW